MAKRNLKLRRKGKPTATLAESWRCLDFIIQLFQTIRSASVNQSLAKSATFQQLLGTRLIRHKDKSVRVNSYFHSIVFFFSKWDENKTGQWSTDSILKEVSIDFQNWPQSRKWRTLEYDLEEVDESLYQQKIIYRRIHSFVKPKKAAKKRKRTREETNRKAKKAKVIRQSSSDAFSAMDVEGGGQPQEAEENQDNTIPVVVDTEAPNAPIDLAINNDVSETNKEQSDAIQQEQPDDEDGGQANLNVDINST